MKLGDTIRDTITGCEGVLIARTEWIYGCIRLTIQPKALKDGVPLDSQTFDLPQMEPVLNSAGMPTVPPDADAPGGPRPSPSRGR